jgi:hypothetical protein
VGALGGALAGSGRRERPSVYCVIGAAVAFAALGTLVGLATSYWLVVVLLVPTGFFMVFFAQASNQRVQLGVDAAFRGRVMALWVLVFLGTNPVGAPLVGWVAETYGAGASICARCPASTSCRRKDGSPTRSVACSPKAVATCAGGA